MLHRRHVERFAQLLDEADGARRHHSQSSLDEEIADLVRTGHKLIEDRPDVTMRASAREEIRAVIMAEAERNGIGVTAKTTADPAIGRARVGTIANAITTKRPFARRVRARGAILVGLAAGTLAISGIAAASGGAMPGDTLYGLKRSQESAQLALATSPVNKGQLYLDFALKRMGEAQADTKDAKAFGTLLTDMDTDSRLGAALLFSDAISHHDQNALTTVDAFYAKQYAQITAMLGVLSATDARHGELLTSWANLERIKQRWIDVRAALNCSTTPTLAGSDSYGPTVTPCSSTTPSPSASRSGSSTGGQQKTHSTGG